MSLRVAIRNWLLKPSAAELASDPVAVSRAGRLIWGHVQRDMQREGDGAIRVVDFGDAQPGELD